MNTKITILLLTHKSGNLVFNFLKKLYGKFRIIIVDNSHDVELEKKIKKNYPKISFKFMDDLGYGSAINYGCKFVKTEYFLISNPDICGLDENKINIFLQTAKKLNNSFSVIGPRYINSDPKSLNQSNTNEEIAEMRYLSGACMFFNKKNFDLIGGFDEKFYLYFEENDFCKRSIKFYKNYQINSIKIIHNVGTSVVTNSLEEKLAEDNLRSWHFIWSKFYYFKKHFGFFLAIIYFIPIIFRINFRIFLYSLNNDNIKKKKYIIRKSGLYSSILNHTSYRRNKIN